MLSPRITPKDVIALCLLGLFGLLGAIILLSRIPESPITTTPRVRGLQASNVEGSTSDIPPAAANPAAQYANPVASYTKEDVRSQFELTEKNILMVFESDDGTFKTYGQVNNGKHVSGVNHNINWLLAHALFANFPVRFSPGAPPLQLLFSAADYPELVQTGEQQFNNRRDFAPVLQFGSVARDGSLLPTFKAMPFPALMPCIIRWALKRNIREQCIFDDPVLNIVPDGNTLPWDNLKPQIVWRGSDFSFLDAFRLGLVSGSEASIDFGSATTPLAVADALLEKWDRLIPRWRGVALSLKASVEAQHIGGVPWIDAKFLEFPDDSFFSNRNFEPFAASGSEVATDYFLSLGQQADYKYHIDLGGIGGTSWLGTLTKLAMPGVLFHHETLTKDWYYDEIQPWVHYIPVKMDLSDLREKFEWAEAHPEECKAISAAATEFVLNMKSDEYMKDMYFKYFNRHLSDVALAYVPMEGETAENIEAYYYEKGIVLQEFATCDKESCTWDNGGNKKYDTSIRPV